MEQGKKVWRDCPTFHYTSRRVWGRKASWLCQERVFFVGDSSHCHEGTEDRLGLQTPCGHPSKPITTRSQRSCLGNCDEAEFAGSSCQAIHTGLTAGIRQSSTILGMLIPSHILGSFSDSGLHNLGNLKRSKIHIKVLCPQDRSEVSQLCLFLG